MRIASYNILTGGEGRADPLIEVLLAQRADVVGLVEAEDPTVLERIARRLKMDYVQATGNKSGASALLSRFPIRDSINQAAFQPDLSKSLLQASVVDPSGQAWQFGVVHRECRGTAKPLPEDYSRQLRRSRDMWPVGLVISGDGGCRRGPAGRGQVSPAKPAQAPPSGS